MVAVNYTKKMKNNIYVSLECIKNIRSERVYDEIREEFGFDYEKHDEFCEIPRSFGNADTEPINIDDVINILSDLKEMGSTHVQMEYDSDHYEYMFSGMKIQLADEKLIAKYEKHREKEKNIDMKIGDLYKQIAELKQERKIIED
jgi:hypothetical protein